MDLRKKKFLLVDSLACSRAVAETTLVSSSILKQRGAWRLLAQPHYRWWDDVTMTLWKRRWLKNIYIDEESSLLFFKGVEQKIEFHARDTRHTYDLPDQRAMVG